MTYLEYVKRADRKLANSTPFFLRKLSFVMFCGVIFRGALLITELCFINLNLHI